MSNAIVFKRIKDADIRRIENFIRYELQEILQLIKQNTETINESDYCYFFGAFAENPENFEFSVGERDLILKLVKHVQYILDYHGTDTGLNHFLHYDNNELENKFEIMCRIDSRFGSFFREEVLNAEKTNLSPKSESHTHQLLGKLFATADINLNRPKSGYRFDSDIKDFASYVRMLSGRFAYETIQKNLPLALPSIICIDKNIQQMNCQMMEGVLRIDELKKYLKDRNLPNIVSISEDATRITGQVQYYAKFNQISGFVLPTNQENGMPIANSFRARNASEIYSYFAASTPVGQYVNVIMAQPLANVSAFCLLLFASDNKYTADEVSKRWKHIVNELKKTNIETLTISSDSDPRFNSAMRRNSKLGAMSNIFDGKEWFSCGNQLNFDANTPIYVQDTIHIATKLRNFFLKTISNPDKLPFGKKLFIRIQHLEDLIQNFPKDVHQLTATILNPNDKQNFSSVQRLCSSKVMDLLEKHVANSEATIAFLRLIHDIVAVFMEENLSPIERIKKLWYCVFIIRIWRMNVQSQKKFTLKNNFITQNCYSCIELNAHALVLIILRLQLQNKPELFIPNLYGSQPCEQIFRQVRSFTSTYSTVANCSVKEIIGRINKIQLQNDISLNSTFIFPRVKNANNIVIEKPQILPSMEEIGEAIEKSKFEAIYTAIKFGLIKKNQFNAPLVCGIPFMEYKENKDVWSDMKDVQDEVNEVPKFNYMALKDFSKKFIDKELNESSPYVEVSTIRRDRVIIKKSSLCWLLKKELPKLSSDRLKRVKTGVIAEKISIPCIPKKLKTFKIKRQF